MIDENSSSTEEPKKMGFIFLGSSLQIYSFSFTNFNADAMTLSIS